MVRFEQVEKRYAAGDASVLALTEIDFEIGEGEFVCLLGPSGCGKSTLLKIVAGLIPATGGTITLRGTKITAPGPDRAVVFQDYALFPWMTVEENVEFGLEARNVPLAERRETSQALLEVVGIADFAKHYPHHLSGGMKQRVSIARALAVEPDLLLMDEPFGALDAQTRSFLQDELLRIWRQFRKTVIFVTHSIEEALYLGDRVVVMTARPGRIKSVISVSAERPRDLTDPDMARFHRQTRALLTEEISRSIALEEADMIAG